jgi:hypothetical protein
MEFLFANLIPIVVVVSIVIRIYTGMKKAAAAGNQSGAPVFREQEEPDEEDDTGEALVPPPQKDFSRPLLTSTAFEGQTFPPPENPHLLIASPLSDSTMREGLPREAERNNFAAPDFFSRIGGLPPMKQAVILSEILGPPKGMS